MIEQHLVGGEVVGEVSGSFGSSFVMPCRDVSRGMEIAMAKVELRSGDDAVEHCQRKMPRPAASM